MNVFEAVRNAVPARRAAEALGFQVNRSGMISCPFHDDKNPSMKVDQRFHCFGCQADGDAIDFTARLFGLSKKEAAIKLADTFKIYYEDKIPKTRYSPMRPAPSPSKEYKEAEDRCFRVFCEYASLLRKWRKEFAPKTMEENFDNRFIEALKMTDYVDYVLHDVFLSGTISERAKFVKTHSEEVLHLERRISLLTRGGTESGPSCGGSAPEAAVYPETDSQNRLDV